MVPCHVLLIKRKNLKKYLRKRKITKKTTTGAKIGKKRKTVAHSQEHQSAVPFYVLLCDFLCSSLVPCYPLILVTFLVPSYNCAKTIFRPATRTSTLDIYSALLSVSDLCATCTYIFCAIPSSTFSRAEQVLPCNHVHARCVITLATVCHLQCW